MSTDSHALLIAELALARQQTARLREALNAIGKQAANAETLIGYGQAPRETCREITRLVLEALAGGEGAEPATRAVDLPTIGNRLAEAIDAELARARVLFPMPNKNFTALVEEVGELAQALLKDEPDNVRAEAIQVAVMAIRVHSEGDPTLTEPSK